MIKKILIIVALVLSTSVGAFFYLLEKDWVDFSTLEYYAYAKPSLILDEDGREIARFQLDRRTPTTYDKFPAILIKAFLAAEDHRFFEHSGISLKGIMRSLLVNIYHRRVMQGASTITQQLAKLMFLSYERTLYRKIQEIFLAFQLERQLSKEQILELYLNNIYFGRGIYGVEAACQRFWNKPLSELTVAQAATIAAVAKSARYYSPLNAPATAKKRRDIILGCMNNLGLITPQQYKQALAQKLTVSDFGPGNQIRLYIQEWIRQWAESKWGREALYRNGLRIKTTLNLDYQESAEESFVHVLHLLRKQVGPSMNGGLVSLESHSGRIKAFIGGYDFKQSQFNRAFQAHRQMGSSFKPILYAYATRAGIGMDTVMVDEPLEVTMPNGTVYTPKNWTNQFDGPMTLVRALTLSNNMIAIKLFLQLCSPDFVAWVRQFGLASDVALLPSAALGTTEVTVEENCAAFNVFANNGVYVKPHLIEWVKDEHDTKLWEHESEKHRVLDLKTNSKMVNALTWNMKRSQRVWADQWINCESIGKSGSTNGAASMWFVGATPDLTTAVYVGRDDNKPMGSQAFASRTAFPVWLMFNRNIPVQKKHFYYDPELKEVTIDWLTGQQTNEQPLADYELRVVKILK